MRTKDLKWVGMSLLSIGIVGCAGSQAELTQTQAALSEVRGQLEQVRQQLTKTQAELSNAQAVIAQAQKNAPVASATTTSKVAPVPAPSPAGKDAPMALRMGKKQDPNKKTSPVPANEQEQIVAPTDPIVAQEERLAATQDPVQALKRIKGMQKEIAAQKEQLDRKFIMAAADNSDTNPLQREIDTLNRRSLGLARLEAKQQTLASARRGASVPGGDEFANQATE